MHVNFDRKKQLLRAEFVGHDVVALVNYLKPFRNNAPVGEWLRILEPLCAPLVEGPHVCRFFPIPGGDEEGMAREGCSCGVVREITEDTSEADEQETVQAEEELTEEEFRPSSDDEISEKLKRLPQVTGHTPQELEVICRNCGIAQWRHVLGSNRCQVNGVLLGTYFRPPLMLEASPDDGAKFAVTVGESEVRCG